MRHTKLITLALVALPLMATAQSYDDLARISVLPGWRTTEGDHMAALQITLKPGWVTYWRAPGDAGIPPQISFAGDSSIRNITPQWPTPQVFGSYGMLSIGYYDAVTVPLAIDLDDPAGPVAISGEITIGVCEEICIPVTLAFDQELPAKGAPDPAILASLERQPVSGAAAGVDDVVCRIAPIDDGLQVTTEIAIARQGASEHVVVETADPRIWVSEAIVTRDGGVLRATVEMVHPSGAGFALDRSGIRMTVLGATRAVDIQGCTAG